MLGLPVAGPPSAAASLNMTPQELNLYLHHRNNLAKLDKGGGIRTPEGVETVRQISTEGPDGRTYNIPTIWNGRELKPHQAVEMALKFSKGDWHYWPSYPDVPTAESRYGQMHKIIAQDVVE